MSGSNRPQNQEPGNPRWQNRHCLSSMTKSASQAWSEITKVSFCIFTLHKVSFCIFNIPKVSFCIFNLHKVSFWIWMAYVSPQALGDVEQQKLSFYADTTAWDKTSCCFSKQKASKRQCRRPPTHRDRAGWVHCLQVSTIWAIACRAYLEMTK